MTVEEITAPVRLEKQLTIAAKAFAALGAAFARIGVTVDQVVNGTANAGINLRKKS
jgi:hypothetical protein